MSAAVTELTLEGCLDRHRRSGGPGCLAVVDSVDSTNRLARRVAEAYLGGGRPAPRLTLIARAQSAGRGRRGRRWASPSGQGIYTSLLLPLPSPEPLAALPLLVPVALCEALEDAGVICGVKWPNDLMAGGRKLGGVLIEALAGSRAAIIGYGVNGAQSAGDLPAKGATSLGLEGGGGLDLSRLAVDLAAAVWAALATAAPTPELIEAYRRRSVHRPGDRLRCRAGDEEVAGRFAGFDERGRLRLATAEGERRIAAAEILGATAAAAEPADAG